MQILSCILLLTSLANGIRAEDSAASKGLESSTVVQGNNEFALHLYRSLGSDQKGNLFFSPYSVSSALAMTYAGAKGETAEQMQKVLKFKEPGKRLHAAFGELTKSFDVDIKNGLRLAVANSLWAQKGTSFKKEFLRLTGQDYGAAVKEVDFIKHSAAASKAISGWAETATGGKIRDLISPSDLSADARLVLADAVYFEGLWASPFEKRDTSDKPFYLQGGKEVGVQTMHRSGNFRHAESADLQVLELPYKFLQNRFSFVVLLPRQREGLQGLEESLTESGLSELLGKPSLQEVEVYLPRFKLTARSELGPVLKSMGMTDAFDPAHADFSGMAGKRDLAISKVIHQTFLDVTEAGTEAAAATAVATYGSALRVPEHEGPILVFRADHPFLFLIRDRTTGSILFLGRLADPKAAD